MQSIEQLYEQVFNFEKSGRKDQADRVRERIRKILLEGHPLSEKDVIKRFLDNIRKKPLVENLTLLKNKQEIPELQQALMLTSYITHSLIEVDKTGPDVFVTLRVAEAGDLLSKYIHGEIGGTEVNSFFTPMLEYV